MRPFLQQIAEMFWRRYGGEVRRLAFVFPSRRAGVFFRKYLSEAASGPLFAPAILTVDGLFGQMSSLVPADRLRTLFALYRIYERHSGGGESFDDFALRGEMLLADFDEVDKYLVDARQLFTNLSDLHDIDGSLDYLSRGQVEAIRSFWSSFRGDGGGGSRGQFVRVWEMLYSVYSELRATLAAEGAGYGGMICREVVERVEREGRCGLPYAKTVFVGLNALTTAEARLLQLMRDEGVADFYWDYAAPALRDADNAASAFAADNLRRFPSAMELAAERFTFPEIEVTGTPSRIGQAKHVFRLIEEMPADEAMRTAIVLADEQLLIPVLHSIPEAVGHINVTLGYPLSGSPAASLIDCLVAAHRNLRTADGRTTFYCRDALALLNHPFVRAACPAAAALAADIRIHNRIRVDEGALCADHLTRLIFSTGGAGGDIASRVADVMRALSGRLAAPAADGDDDTPAASADSLDSELIYRCMIIASRMKELTAESGISMNTETCGRLLKRLIDTDSIPFRGEPLAGIQIMGVLETRVLDFDRLVILSANEGIFPRSKADGSFIPHSLRRGFGLPTADHRDSIAAYHFYRMIARARRVSIIYDTRTEGVQSGEVSRFVHQLRYHYRAAIRDRLVVYDIAPSQPAVFRVEKTGEVARRLGAYLDSASGAALSASAINTFIDCPLKFFFAYIEKMKEDDDVTETVESRTFGTILHKAMELLYDRLRGATVTADALDRIAGHQSLTEVITRAFAEAFFHTDRVQPLTGQHYLTGEIVRKYMLKAIERDRLMTPFRFVAAEKKITGSLNLTDGRTVSLKGYIDRIDEAQGKVRIVDFKTGRYKKPEFRSMEQLFDSAAADRPQAVMQVFMYAWMYGLQAAQPAIYYVRNLFADDFDSVVYWGRDRTPVADFSPLRNDFEAALRACLDVMFGDGPFVQTAQRQTCRYCMFANVCGTTA